jgi:hypothetical protein
MWGYIIVFILIAYLWKRHHDKKGFAAAPRKIAYVNPSGAITGPAAEPVYTGDNNNLLNTRSDRGFLGPSVSDVMGNFEYEGKKEY